MSTDGSVDSESEVGHDPSDGAEGLTPSTDSERDATNLAIASAGLSIIGFIALFRLTSGLDRTRASALRRFFAVIVESSTAVGLGFTALGRLRSSPKSAGTPLAAVGVGLGLLNVVRVFRWLRLSRPAA
jgi:hypothetical protein